MTGWTGTENERHEQSLLAESLPSPDTRLPLATVEPEQYGDGVAQATGAGGVPLAALGPMPRGTRR